MKLIRRLALAAAMQTILIMPASAQWQGSIGVSRLAATHTEYDKNGRRIVREEGWLPGFAVSAAYRMHDYTWFTESEVYERTIGYHGQTQAGIPVDSRTSTGLASFRIGGRYAFSARYSVLAALEWDKWRRNILGAGGVAGLQEKYRSRRVIAGAASTWRLATAGTASVEAAAVISEPERLQVGFSGLLDPAALETKWSHGFRMVGSFRPSFAPHLELRSRYDWIKISRSADTPVTLEGRFMGTIAQPEHTRQALTITVLYVF